MIPKDSPGKRLNNLFLAAFHERLKYSNRNFITKIRIYIYIYIIYVQFSYEINKI